jgi:2-polyprenyl-3-methyl-5-hydroxy-6-metoxy-1,4-benzoquinol methylase
MENVKCILCGSSEAAAYYQLADYLLERPEVLTRLVKCQQCGLVYQNPRPALNEMQLNYPSEYDSYAVIDHQSNSWLLNKAFEYGIYKRCRVVTRRKSSGRLLDIGCSTGAFLRGMSKYPGWELEGVEISSYAAEIGRNRFGLNIFIGTVEQADFPAQHFDVITLWDVMEHLHDPISSLTEISRILKPGGLLILRVPNLDSFDAHLFGPYWAGLDSPRHLYVFSQRTINGLIVLTNFTPIHYQTRIGSYPAFLLSLRFWSVAKGLSQSKRNTLLRVLNHPIARLAAAPLFSIINTVYKGPNLIVVARKSI